MMVWLDVDHDARAVRLRSQLHEITVHAHDSFVENDGNEGKKVPPTQERRRRATPGQVLGPTVPACP